MIQLLSGIEGIGDLAKQNIKFDRVLVNVANTSPVRFSQNTERSITKVVGIAISGTNDEAIDKSLLDLYIGANEIFPRDFPAKLIRSGQEVAPNQRYFIFNRAIDVKSSEIKGTYTNTVNGVEYQISIYLLGFTDI